MRADATHPLVSKDKLAVDLVLIAFGGVVAIIANVLRRGTDFQFKAITGQEKGQFLAVLSVPRGGKYSHGIFASRALGARQALSFGSARTARGRDRNTLRFYRLRLFCKAFRGAESMTPRAYRRAYIS